MCSQPQHSINDILVSQKSVRNVNVSIRAEFFGIEWAQGPGIHERYSGKISAWASKKDESLKIKWDGWDTNKINRIETLLGDDENGDNYEFRIEPNDDGSLVEFISPAPPAAPAAAAGRRHAGAAPDAAADDAPAVDGAEDADDDEDEAEEDAADEAPVEVDKKGMLWKRATPTSIAVDVRTQARMKPKLTSDSVSKVSIIDLYEYLTPDAWYDTMLKYTNPQLRGDGVHAKTTKGELKQWWGYALGLALNPGKSIEQMWSTTPDPNDILPPPAMGRHGMIFKRWKALRSAMRFGPEDAPSLEQNPWCFVELMVEQFNKHMAEAICPGWLLTIDESMCAWRGKQGLNNPFKIPALSWVPRKPEPLGAELKTTACALSGLLLYVEICKGKATHSKQKFFEKVEQPHTTATTMRLVEDWFGTERAVYGDSWFASVKTAVALLRNGLHFVGDVKTNHALFPKAELEQHTSEERGAWAVYSSKVDIDGESRPIFGVSHRRGPSVHEFISTFGTTLPGKAHIGTIEDDEDEHQNVTYELERKCPRILNDASSAQPTIDRHNRYRQFILALEKRILTDHFCMRFATTMHGMLFTNAFFALRHFGNEQASFKDEMRALSMRLMHNPLRAAELAAMHPGRSPSTINATRTSSPLADEMCDHVLIPLSQLKGYTGAKEPRCNMCNKGCSWICVTCTKDPKLIFPCHPAKTRAGGGKPGKEYSCHALHKMGPTEAPRGRRKTKRVRTEAADFDADTMECEEIEDEDEDAEEDEMDDE